MMNWRPCLLLIILFLFVSFTVFPQSAKFSVGKEPSWIVKDNIDYTKTSLDKDASEGSVDIHFEAQISLAEHCKYVKQSKKLISNAGVQDGSTVTVSFDPSYEQLTFHTIEIIRNGEILNKLDPQKIKTVHQEKDLDNFIYNGIIDAILILEDVRKGDIIEYSYNIKGYNPVFDGKYTGEFGTEFSVPVYNLFYRLMVPDGRTINIKSTNDTLRPVITKLNGQQVYEWHKTNIAPLILQDNLPSWYDPYGRFNVSEYKDWKEVNDWAMRLFPLNKSLSAAVQKKIAEIEKIYTDDAARTNAALRFVQDDIRYMGIEIGRNTHKPADPSKVFLQRFGDCKEKSYLLCCMLHAMNIEANPVLINATVKKDLNDMLPAATDFDHCTVRVKLDSGYYWFDPTIAYQRGNIKELFYPDYQTGLIINANTTSLTPIPFRKFSYQHINEYFKVKEMFGEGNLIVTTTFKGEEADEIRNRFNKESVTEILKGDKEFYGKYYEDIKADSLTYTDDDSTGIFTTTENYTLPKFWTISQDEGKKFSFTAFLIDDIIYRPREKERKMPMELKFPVSYKEEVIVYLPQEWSVTASEVHLTNKGFGYNSKFFCVYNEVHLAADYENYKDFITTDESAEYFKNIKEHDNHENYVLSLGDNEDANKSSKSSSKDVLSIIIFVVCIAGFFIWWNRRSK